MDANKSQVGTLLFVSFGEARRKMLLQFKGFKHPGPGVPSYLINEEGCPIVFGQDRILTKKTREV